MTINDQRRTSCDAPSPFIAGHGLELVIDQEALRALSAHDPGLARELLVLFVHQAGLLLSRLGQAEDLMSLRDLAHALHGAALAVAASRLATMASALARLADQADATGWRASVEGVIAEGERTRAVIAIFLEQNRDF